MEVSDNSLEKYRHDLAIVRETAQQVIRDFQYSNHVIEFSGDPFKAYEELLGQIEPLLKKLIKGEPSRLSALLYRVDIPESKIRNLPQGTERSRALAEIILQREFQKVLIRRYFKDKGL